MRKSMTFIAIICFLSTSMACADDARKVAKDINSGVIVDTAQKMCQAMLAEDYEKLTDYTLPKVVEVMGGREAMIAKIKSTIVQMKKSGYGFKSCRVDAPTVIADAGNDIVAIVPEVLEMTVPAGKATSKSYLIAVSSDQGKTWTFLDGAGVTRESLKTFLPNFPSQLKLPAKEQPVVEPNK